MDHLQLITALGAKMHELDMTMSLLYSVIERTGQQREGYYALRQINDLSRTAYQVAGPEELLTNLSNLIATVQATIDRFDA